MSSLLDSIGGLFSPDGFIPRRICGLWPDWLVWEHVGGNALIWLAYLALPAIIWRLGRRGPDWGPLAGTLRAGACFIGLCGIGHFLDMMAFYVPLYRLSGHVLVATGLVSCWTVWTIRQAWPAIVAMKGPAEFARIIAERTEELARTNTVLRDSEARFRQLADAMPQIVWIARPDGAVEYFNRRWYEYTGLPAISGEEASWTSVIHPDDLQNCLALWRQALEAGTLYEVEYRFREGRNGEYRWHLGRALPVKDEQGRVVHWFGTGTDIDDYKRAETALRTSEERFQSLAESIPQLAWMARPDGHIFWYNRRWYDYTGTTPEEMEGWGWKKVHDPEVLPTVLDRWQGAIAEGVPFEMVFPLRGADGRFREFLTRVMPSRDSGGRVHLWFGTNTDIDEMKRADEALRESERRLHSLNQTLDDRVRQQTAALSQRVRLIDQANDAIVVRSAEGRIANWNRGAERMYGWTKREAEGCISHELLKTRFPMPLAEIDDHLEEFAYWEGELIHEGKDGAMVVVASRWVLDRDGGEDQVVLEINLDVTERNKAEEALQRGEAALREAQRLAGVGSWEWDPIGDVVTWSDELYRIAGRDPSRPPPGFGEHGRLYTPESLAALASMVQRALEAGEPFEIELELIREDGAHRWIIARGEAIRDPGGRVSRLRGTAQDVTERRADREELRLARDQAVAATQAKGDFLANMSHEIRTPMNGVIGMTELLLDTPLNELQGDYTRTIRNSGEALLSVINDILDFSKIEAGKMAIKSEEFELLTLIEEVAELLAPRAQQKGLEINCLVDRNVPARVEGDPARIRQVLMNLAGNAVKFTDRGEVNIEAATVSSADGVATIRVLVRDTGIGIPADRQGDVFESFTQVAGAHDRKQGGTGLGLTISRRLVVLMGGSIGLESSPGRGSTFWFELPLGIAAGGRPAYTVRHDRPRVLVVDDLETSRTIAREALLSLGCRPEVAATGEEAIERLLGSASDPFRLVLIDDDMPGMGGLEAARRIRGLPGLAGVPLILLTTLRPSHPGLIRDHGLFAATLRKPIRLTNLDAALLRAMAPEAPTGDRPAETPGAPRLSARIRVLLAEDNEVNRRVATGMAERFGCLVDTVRDGREALEALDYGRHDLILMDVQMPEMDGFAATAAIRDLERSSGLRIPIIAMTAHAMEGDRERCLAAGMDDYLTKPVRPGPLREALLTWGGPDRRPSPSAASAGPDEPPSFSPELLRESCGTPEVVREVIELLLAETPGRLDLLLAAIVKGDGRRISREAHGLQGGFSTIGAKPLGDSCESLMTSDGQDQVADRELDFRRLLRQWERLRRDLIAHLHAMPDAAPTR